MKQPLIFSQNILFIEFFIREYKFYGKGRARVKLPSDSFFYTGSSKAVGYKYETPPPLIAFDKEKPFLSENITDEIITKLFKENTNIVCSINGESVDTNNTWFRTEHKLTSNKTGIKGNQGQLPYSNLKSIAPYGFSILNIDSNETIKTNFPRENIILDIDKGQTLCYLCRKEEKGDGEWYSPNINLVLFVKNHGLHDHIEYRSQTDINRIANTNQLCLEKFDIRDFRKSSLNFELG